jgi:hypothetical protein
MVRKSIYINLRIERNYYFYLEENMIETKECFVCHTKILVNTEDGKYHDQYECCPNCEKECQEKINEYFESIK